VAETEYFLASKALLLNEQTIDKRYVLVLLKST